MLKRVSHGEGRDQEDKGKKLREECIESILEKFSTRS